MIADMLAERGSESKAEDTMRRILISVFPFRVATLVFIFLLLPLPIRAQQVGASLTGHVIDPSAAAVYGATLALRSTTTEAVYTVGTDSAGIYQFPFVLIGTYTLTVEKPGFKKYVQEGIGLVAAQKAVIDITLELGAVTQSVSVVANAPILQAESGDRNATISNVRLDPEVIRGQNTIVTTWLTPGVTLTAAVKKIRPWDTSGSEGERINGGQEGFSNGSIEQAQWSGNQVMVDGVSVNHSGEAVAFNLMASAVDQVTVVGTLYDAQYGWSTGGHINTLSKAGNNTWHVHAYDYVQNTLFNARDWSAIQQNTPKLPWHMNIYGGEIGGPLRKDKIFVYYAYQMIRQVQPAPFTSNVPTAAMRQGNFNGVLFSGAQLQLYDPSTTSLSTSNTDPTSCYNTVGQNLGANPCRSQSGPLVSGNQILSINPIAAKVLSIIPLPNGPGLTQTCPSGVNASVCGTFAGNIFNTRSSRKLVDYFPEHSGRIDWNFSDKTHAFFRFSKNDLAETGQYVFSTVAAINPAESSGDNPIFRGNQDYTLQVTRTFNPTTVLEIRHGMDRYPTGAGDETGVQYDPAALGFSSTFANLVLHNFPMFSVSGMAQMGGTPPGYLASDIWTTEAVLAHTHGRHNLRLGLQRFDLADYLESPGNTNGCFSLTGYFTGKNPLGSVGPTGYGLADFELGMPGGGNCSGYAGLINQPADPEYWMHEYSWFVQDDFHLSRRFTLNMGLRWDYAGPVSDKYNRLLNGFCFSCTSPLGNIPGLGTLVGGPTFAGVGGAPSGIFHRKYDNYGPRVGFAYNLGHNMVLRGGWGMIYGQQFLEPGAAPGFSGITTFNAVPGPVGIFNPNLTFANMFTSGLSPIAGSSFGLATNIGRSISFFDPDTDVPRTQQYSLELQRSFGHNWMISLAYVGSTASRLNIDRNLNFVPLADLPYTPGFQVNPTGYTQSQLNAALPNPFAGNIPSLYASQAAGTYLTNSTIPRSYTLLPYPQFAGGVADLLPIGKSHYHSMQFEVNKRLSMGLEFSANFTWSRTMQALGFVNAQDPSPAQSVAPFDCPRQVKVNMAYFAPFGPGQKFLNTTNPVVTRLVSGWSLSATPMLMDGFPAPAPSGVMPTGASLHTQNPTLSHWFNTCWLDLNNVQHDCAGQGPLFTDSTPAWKQMVAGQLIGWSPFLRGIRYVGHHRLDAGIKKETPIKERWQLIYRADFINAFNSSEWNTTLDVGYTDATFGMVGYPFSIPVDDPRVIMMSLQLRF
jgi:hypothetical protein